MGEGRGGEKLLTATHLTRPTDTKQDDGKDGADVAGWAPSSLHSLALTAAQLSLTHPNVFRALSGAAGEGSRPALRGSGDPGQVGASRERGPKRPLPTPETPRLEPGC